MDHISFDVIVITVFVILEHKFHFLVCYIFRQAEDESETKSFTAICRHLFLKMLSSQI